MESNDTALDTLSERALTSHPSDERIVKVFAIRTKRTPSPADFSDALEREGPRLLACAENLSRAGHNPELQHGTRIFVRPEYYNPVLDHLRISPAIFESGETKRLDQMRQWHFIVAEEFSFELETVLNSFRSHHQIVPQDEALFRVLTDRPPFATEIDRGFIRVRDPSSIYSGASGGAKASSWPESVANVKKRKSELNKANSSQSLGGCEPDSQSPDKRPRQS